MEKKDYDAIVVGAGPNGLAAAITLQRAGWTVLIVESNAEIGGGTRTAELTLPGFKHDVCSAIHPMALASPFMRSLPLSQFGLELIQPEFAVAHPFDDGASAILSKAIIDTAVSLGADSNKYVSFINPLVEMWPSLEKDILGPLRIPNHPLTMAQFGLKALPSALTTAKYFSTRNGKALWAGVASHSMQPLSNIATSAIGIVLMIAAHKFGWPVIKGGSHNLTKAMCNYFISLGGKVETNFHVRSLSQLPSSRVVLFDVTPKQLLGIAGHRFSPVYTSQLKNFRYGAGVFKIDWALDEQTPFTSAEARRAGTVHIGNTIEEIAHHEQQIWENKMTEKPFVLFAQQSVCDASRAPKGKHTAWAYCHVPHGYNGDMTSIIENQVERFAPGFKERIIGRYTFNAAQLESYNNNYIGGDINGGVLDIRQLFTRPALRWSPYRTSAKGLYICSSSTPPGGGVHGLCGYHAARQVLRDVDFKN